MTSAVGHEMSLTRLEATLGLGSGRVGEFQPDIYHSRAWGGPFPKG